MPINELRHQLRELGRIKLGEEDGDRPVSLDTFRLTSRDRHLLDAAADAFGGTVGATDRGFELTTDLDALDVAIPHQDVAAGQWFELWAAGGLQRRCDGDQLEAGGPCLCSTDDRQCKPTTVLRVVLPQLPDLGLWRLTTRSWYAAGELPTAVTLLLNSTSAPLVPAVLAIDHRKTKRPGEPTKNYTVPVLRSRSTLADLLAGNVEEVRTLEAAGPIAVLDTATGEITPVPAPSGPTAARNPDPGPETPEPTISPEWAALAAFLDQHHPGDLTRDTGELIELLTELEGLMLTVGLWHRGEGGTLPLDIAAVTTFDTVDDPGLWRSDVFKTATVRMFATRALMGAHTKVRESRLGGLALRHQSTTEEEQP